MDPEPINPHSREKAVACQPPPGLKSQQEPSGLPKKRNRTFPSEQSCRCRGTGQHILVAQGIQGRYTLTARGGCISSPVINAQGIGVSLILTTWLYFETFIYWGHKQKS